MVLYSTRSEDHIFADEDEDLLPAEDNLEKQEALFLFFEGKNLLIEKEDALLAKEQ